MAIYTPYAAPTSLSPGLYNLLHLGVYPYSETALLKVTRKFHLPTCNDQFLLPTFLTAQQHLTCFLLALILLVFLLSSVTTLPALSNLSTGVPQRAVLSPRLLMYIRYPGALHPLLKLCKYHLTYSHYLYYIIICSVFCSCLKVIFVCFNLSS